MDGPFACCFCLLAPLLPVLLRWLVVAWQDHRRRLRGFLLHQVAAGLAESRVDLELVSVMGRLRGREVRLELRPGGLGGHTAIASAAGRAPLRRWRWRWRADELLAALERLIGPDAAPPPVRVGPAPAPGLRCPFCHDALAAHGEQTVCGACGTPHHTDCLEQAGCTVLGCAGARADRSRARPDDPLR